MSKAKKTTPQSADAIQAAIYSLYDKYPLVSRCHDVNTRETKDLEKKIAQRKKELENDAKLVKLQTELADLKKQIMSKSVAGRKSVEKLMNRLRLRGVTDELIADIEKADAAEGIIEVDRYCE